MTEVNCPLTLLKSNVGAVDVSGLSAAVNAILQKVVVVAANKARRYHYHRRTTVATTLPCPCHHHHHRSLPRCVACTQVLAKGFPIPTLDGVKFVNTTLSFGDGFVELATDLQFDADALLRRA